MKTIHLGLLLLASLPAPVIILLGVLGLVCAIPLLILGMIVVTDIYYWATRPRLSPSQQLAQGFSTPQGPSVLAANLRTLMQRDNAFDPELFLQRAQALFLLLVTARTDRNLMPVRQFLTPRLYEQWARGVDHLEVADRANFLAALRVNDMKIFAVDLKTNPPSVILSVGASAANFQADRATGAITFGTNQVASFEEYWVFVPAGETHGDDPISSQCPKCGAPNALTTEGVCRFCGQRITIAPAGWVVDRIAYGNSSTAAEAA